jgi:hypothetical protein
MEQPVVNGHRPKWQAPTHPSTETIDEVARSTPEIAHKGRELTSNQLTSAEPCLPMPASP